MVRQFRLMHPLKDLFKGSPIKAPTMKDLIFASAILTTPQVPRYDPNSVEAPRAINPPRAQGLGPEAFGAGIGEGLQKVGRTGMEILKEEKEKADRTATLVAHTADSQNEVDLLYNSEKGALAKRGKDAFDIVEPTLKSYDEKSAVIEGGLSTPEQKQAFRLFSQARRVDIEKQLQRHVSGEMKTYAEEANKASLESTLNNVITNHQDPDRVEQERKFGLGVIMSDPGNKGLPPEAVKMKVATWDSMVQRAVIEKLTVENPSKALEYFTANRDKMLPTDATKVESALKPLVKEVEINAAVDSVFLAADPAATRADLVAQIQTKYKDKPWRKEAEAEIRRLHADREDAQKEVVDGAEAAVYQVIAKVKLDGKIPKKSDVPPEVWADLARVAPEKVSEIADKIRAGQEHAVDRDRTAKDRRDTQATIESLTTWGMLKSNPETLRSVNLDKLLGSGKITRTHYQDLITDQLAIKQGKGEHEAKLLSDKAAVDQVLSAAGIDDKKHPEKVAKFYDALTGRMKVFEAENGRKPKQEDVKGMARGLLAEVSQNVNFWPIDKTVRVFEADTSKVRVPDGDRAAIVQALQKNKRPVTEDAIRGVYLERQKRNGGGK